MKKILSFFCAFSKRPVNETATSYVVKIAILLTPRIPQYSIIFFFSALFSLQIGCAQEIEFPAQSSNVNKLSAINVPLAIGEGKPVRRIGGGEVTKNLNLLTKSKSITEDTIYQAILAHYKVLAQFDIEEYEDLKKYNWMRYMPNVGYSALYGVNVSFSFNTVSRVFNENQVKKAKRNQIDKKYVLQSKHAYRQYIRLTTQYKELQQKIEKEKAILQLEKRLFSIYQEQYDSLEIPPSQFLQKEIDYEKKQLEFISLKEELVRIQFELQYFVNLLKQNFHVQPD